MFRQDCTCPALLEPEIRYLPLRGHHPLWLIFPDDSGLTNFRTGLVRVRSPLLAESRLISFPPVTEMFQFSGLASPAYEFSWKYTLRCGFPHSDIFGSRFARNSS